MTQVSTSVTYKSPLHEMTQTTPTCLWNDSAAIQELTYSIENGAVGATCNPVIVLGVLKNEMPLWPGCEKSELTKKRFWQRFPERVAMRSRTDVTVTKDSETASKELVLGPISLDMLLL